MDETPFGTCVPTTGQEASWVLTSTKASMGARGRARGMPTVCPRSEFFSFSGGREPSRPIPVGADGEIPTFTQPEQIRTRVCTKTCSIRRGGVSPEYSKPNA